MEGPIDNPSKTYLLAAIRAHLLGTFAIIEVEMNNAIEAERVACAMEAEAYARECIPVESDHRLAGLNIADRIRRRTTRVE